MLLLPWIAEPIIQVVSFRLAWANSVPPSVSRWFKLMPGHFTFILWVPSAASPQLLIRLPHRIISAAECRTEWIFSQTKYSKLPALRKGNKSAHICTNLLPKRSRRLRSFIVFSGYERLPVKTIFELRAQWILTCCTQSNTGSLFQSYLYRWYHSSNSKASLINSWTGLISTKPSFFSFSLCITSSKRSNKRNGSNSSKWRISTPVTEPRTEPEIFPEVWAELAAEAAIAAFTPFFTLPWMHEAAEKSTRSWTTWEEGYRAGRWIFCQLHLTWLDKSFPACFWVLLLQCRPYSWPSLFLSQQGKKEYRAEVTIRP